MYRQNILEALMFFPKIKEIMTRDVVKIDINLHLSDALKMMQKHDIRDVVVCDNKNHQISLLSSNDLLRQYLLNSDLNRPISEITIPRLPLVDKEASILDVVKKFNELDEYIGITGGKEKTLEGIASYTDIADGIDPRIVLDRLTLGDLVKRHTPKHVGIGTRLQDLYKLFSSPSDAVIIVEENKPKGILTTKDSIRLISANACNDSRVEDHMTTPVRTVSCNISINDALELIKQKHYKRLIVCDEDGTLLGTVSQQDLIGLAYNRWSDLMKSHQDELVELIDVLKQKNSQFEKLVSIDRLTGINNRSKIEELVIQEVERNDRYPLEPPFSILFVDIDYFKKVNDRWGHLMGDSVLKQMGQLLREISRVSDNIGRWGGEEFLVMLPHTSLDEAIIIAERFNNMVREASFESKEQVTVSIGIAQYHKGEGYRSLLHRSDQALYAAKDAGRDCYQIAE
jgi:diguanylate cyclase (GGDEF)-like protein